MQSGGSEASNRGAAFAPARAGSVGSFLDFIPAWGLVSAAEALDVLAVLAAGVFLDPIHRAGPGIGLSYALGVAALAVTCHFSLRQARLYEIDSLINEGRALKTIAMRWTFLCLILAGLIVPFGDPTLWSPRWLGFFYVGGAAGFAVERLGMAWLARHWIARGNHTHAVAILGCNELAEQLIERLKNNSFGIKIVGVFDDRMHERTCEIPGSLKLGGVADLLEYAQRDAVDTVIITLPVTATERLRAIIRLLRLQPLNVWLLPGPIGLERIGPSWLDRAAKPGIHMITVVGRPIPEVTLFFKSFVDRLLALLGLVLAAPILAVCALGIALASPGPILFRQRRVGYKGREFDILKFRTMHVMEQPQTRLTERNDARVFSFGSFLRKTSLDELPQLINVLKGDMSLVGPRPHMPQATAAGLLYFNAVVDYAARHRVKPGMTGWAQVNGWRGPTETIAQIEARVAHDIYYIENWSLMLDLVILARTVGVLFGRNAF